MCNKAVFNCALIVVLWSASVSSVSYFVPKKTHDITRHGKSSSYFHFNQEVPEKVPKHHYFKQAVVRPDESEGNFPYPSRDHLVEKPEYIAPTEPTNYGNYDQENSYDDKPDSSFYREANKYYSSLFKLPEDTHKNRFTTYMEQSTPSYYTHVKLTRPKSTLRKIPPKSLDYESSKFSDNTYNNPEAIYKRPDDFPYSGDFEGYKKPIEFTIPSEYKERKKISEFSYPEKSYPSPYKHYKKPSEFSETAYVNEHKSSKEPEFSYFDEHKLSSKPYKHEFSSYKEPSSVSYYEHSKPIKNHYSSHKDPYDFSYSKKHHFDHFKEAEKAPPVEFQFSYFDKKPHSLESFKEPYISSHLGGYKFVEKPDKNEDIHEEPDFYKIYKNDYSSFKKPSSSSYFSGPKFVEKPTKPSVHFNLFEEPKKYSYSGSISSTSSNKYTQKPFREPSALSMIKQLKVAPTPSLSGSYNKHKSLLDEYYKYQYKKNRYNPQIIKQAFSTATPLPSTTPTYSHHHNSHYDIPKSSRYSGNNDVHSMLSKYANSYFNKQRQHNRYKEYQENAQKYQNIQQGESEVNEIPVNEPQPEEKLPEQPKKEDKKPLMPTIRVEDLNIQDGEVDNRDLEMMVKIVNNILQVLPYNP